MTPRLLVVAKAPVAGLVKTRLGAEVGMERAAELAAAALLDTLRTCTATVGAERCRLALHGDLTEAVDGRRLSAALVGWRIHPQRGHGLGDRLAAAHLDLADEAPGPVVQVGMDTPQVTADLLGHVIDGLADHDAVLGDAEDGGWWVLGLADPRKATVLRAVPMSTPTTGIDTRRALEAAGLSVGRTAVLDDVDTAVDAASVVAECPDDSAFARLWSGMQVRAR
jgi:glycosyltransferase A (GT-A) superfamily protein (DUF2064 family)